MLPEAVTTYLADRQDEHLAQLFELIRFPSVSSQSARDADSLACVRWIASRLDGLGFTTELRPWRSHPILLARSTAPAATDRTLLIYAHYDVQPAEPLDLWTSPPFAPAVRDGYIYGRGASDDKGPLMAHLAAVEAHLATGQLPVNVAFFIEGEEEIGSPDLERFVTESAADLAADVAVISDSEFFAAGVPSITYGLRGLVYLELTLTGPAGDLHSGLHGGAVVNPLNALAAMIAGLHDADGRVTLAGYYDDVVATTDAERAAWAALPFDEAAYAASLGTVPAGGERGLSVLERRWARPTLDCNGIVGGYGGEGSKTVIPATATAKISMRLVPHQRPEKVLASFRQYVADRTPPGIRAAARVSAEARPVLVGPDTPPVGAARDALAEAFGAQAALVRNGASVPVTELIQRVLGIDPILMGLGLPDDNLHAPNERFGLAQFHRGAIAAAALMHNLARRRH